MNKKHGFTLSELLMSIAIIAIVSAMGITIAKRNTDDAYKTYFAVGTMNLNNALAQIESGNVNVAYQNNVLVQQNGAGDPNIIFNNFTILTEHLRYLFGDNRVFGVNAIENINAKNGITYLIGNIVSNNNIPVSVNIQMTVPAPRRRVNGNITDRATTDFLYVRGLDQANLGNQHMLVPLNNENSNADPPLISIQDRQDLLTAYIDDGVVGRHVLNNFMPIRYGTYRDALCSILNQNDSNMSNSNFTINGGTIVNCSAYNDANGVQHPVATHLSLDNSGNPIVNRDAAGNIIGTAPSSGVIKFASPRKLK